MIQYIIQRRKGFELDPNAIEIELPDHNDKTPLHIAAENGFTAIVQELVNADAKILRFDNDKKTAMHYAIAENHATVFNVLLARLDKTFNKKGIHPFTDEIGSVLAFAAVKGRSEMLKALLDRVQVQWYEGLDYRHNIRLGLAMHSTIEHQKIDALELLLDRGGNINSRKFVSKTKEYMTVLHQADRSNFLKGVKALLDAGADINTRALGSKQYTYLHVAVKSRRSAMVGYLLERGADVDAVTADHMLSALHFAVLNGDHILVNRLLEGGANVDGHDGCIYSPLCGAAERLKENIIVSLVNNGADVNRVHQFTGRAPIHYCAELGKSSILDLLLDHGADASRTEASKMFPPLLVFILARARRLPARRGDFLQAVWDTLEPHEIKTLSRLLVFDPKSWQDVPRACPGLVVALNTIWFNAPQQLPNLFSRVFQGDLTLPEVFPDLEPEMKAVVRVALLSLHRKFSTMGNGLARTAELEEYIVKMIFQNREGDVLPECFDTDNESDPDFESDFESDSDYESD